MNIKSPTINFIGEIRSSLKRIEDCPLQERENAPPAEVVIFPEYAEAMKDISEGEDLVVLTWLDRADRSVLQCFPRNHYDAPKIGVFSTRSPHRPNPIGLHVVNVISRSGDGVMVVSNLEVLNGTPVIDIKPVLR